MKRTTWFFSAMVLVVARGAWAGNDFSMNVVVGSDGKVMSCEVAVVPDADAQDDGVAVSVKNAQGVEKAANRPITIRVTRKDDPKVTTVALTPPATTAQLPRGNYADGQIYLEYSAEAVTKDASGKECTRMLAPASMPAAPATRDNPPKPGDPAKPSDPAIQLDGSVVNEKALEFLVDKKIASHGVTGGVHGKVYRLYHLPDGTPAFPLPARASEEDFLEIWVVLPADAKVTVEVLACDKVPDVRVHGSYKDVLAKARPVATQQTTPQFVLTSYPKPLRCAGTLTYKITKVAAVDKESGGSTTTSITLDPIYRFEWSVGYGFDFGRPRRLGLADRKPASGTGTEKVVVDPRDFTGRMPIITLLVDVCGTNPNQLDWCDRFLNPTIWLDPTRLEKGFGAGLTVRPFFGVGILAGVSVFKSTELADGVSANPGDIWTAAGGLPTKEVFNRKSLGLMLAATVDSEIFAQLFK
ncbi:MAG TPA: hypothetical protein VJ801_03935 [Polyangia bacterium]|jgi:hypothetical protein|nr:hypothetical protein [Polyangia bacterium]